MMLTEIPPVELHLVSWNRPKMTELVIKAIRQNTHSDHYRLSVLDNGSDRATLNTLINLHENGYIDELHAMGSNEGLEKARQWLLLNCTFPTTEYIVSIDNDCLPQPIEGHQDWLDKLIELLEKYEDFAAIACRTQVMIGTGNIFEEADKNGDDIVEFPHPGGSLRIMRAKAVLEVGGWDRDNPGRGAEERYICGKLREVGYRTGFATKIHCLHLFGDREQTKERWGYKDGLKPEDTGHSNISHPALEQGDSLEEVTKFVGEANANSYFAR